MPVKLHQILSKKRDHELDFSVIEQFELDEGQDVSAQIIIEERTWHPYTIDPQNHKLIFLDMSPDIDLTQEPFIFPRQFLEATRLLSVPFSELGTMSEQVQMPEELILIFSIGRCGSTLLHQILGQVEGLHSYSEPDVPTMLSIFRKEMGLSDELIEEILVSTMKLQIHATAPENAQSVAFKFRGQVNPLMHYFFDGLPQTKCIFMYRNSIAWARSMYRFLMIFFDSDMLTLDGLKHRFRFYPQNTLDTMGKYLDLSRNQFHLSEYLAVAYIFQLESYQQNVENHALFPLHYDDMLADPEMVIGELLDFCNLPQSQLAQALTGLERDSQAGTEIFQNFSSRELTPEHEEIFRAILEKHPSFAQFDFRLPKG